MSIIEELLDRIFCKELFNFIDIYIKEYDKNELRNSLISRFHELYSDYMAMDIDPDSREYSSLPEAIAYLSIYMEFKGYLDIEQIKLIIHSFYESKIIKYEKSKLEEIGKRIFTKENIELIKSGALESQKRVYSEDYIVYFIEGDKENFDFGNNTFQCPVHLFFKEHDTMEFLKCVCDIDFIRSKYMNSGLYRTKCLCNKNDDCCEFRWKQP